MRRGIRGGEMSVSDYYSMLVCENGHVLTDRLERSSNDTPHCSKCGARTISQCPSCGAKIRGDLRDSGVVVIGYTTPAPKYCPECGAPFPWTTASLDALRELAELDDDLDADDADSLVKSAETALTDGPKTKVAAMRVKKILGKAGKATASAARDLLVDVLAESAKRTIWPN